MPVKRHVLCKYGLFNGANPTDSAHGWQVAFLSAGEKRALRLHTVRGGGIETSPI